MSGALPGSSIKSEPNLTPILDMVFQLITFFMLVINFKSAELDQTLKLPVVGTAKPRDLTTPGQSLMVLNVNRDDKRPNGFIRLYGNEITDIEKYLKKESEVEMKKHGLTIEDIHGEGFENGKTLPVLVVIRADRTAPFSLLDRVLRSCQENGFREFSLKAMNKEEVSR